MMMLMMMMMMMIAMMTTATLVLDGEEEVELYICWATSSELPLYTFVVRSFWMMRSWDVVQHLAFVVFFSNPRSLPLAHLICGLRSLKLKQASVLSP